VRRIVLALAVAAFAAAPLSAQLPDGKWWKRPRIAAFIDLSADQERQLDDIFARNRPQIIDLKANLEKKQFDYDQAMESGADRKVIASKIEARENARAKLQTELALMVLDMRRVLRPEQWEKLTQLQQAFRERMQERRRQIREEDMDLGLAPAPPTDATPRPISAPAPTRRPSGQ
jgi:Spy/CpxP family protein refolding chaperone